MSEPSVQLHNIGKMYRVFRTPGARLLHALGLGALNFWRSKPSRDVWVLKGIDLVLHRGERVGVIGRNGVGKSTLLKIVARTVMPTAGEVVVQGRVRALLELGIGFHLELTGRENIRAALAYEGIADRTPQLEEEIIEFAELSESIDQPLRTYSSGMFTRLAFSVATAVQPEVLIIDEILATGDAYFAGKCLERIKGLSEKSGVSVLMVSHDLSSVQSLCERVLWLEGGLIKMEGKPLEVIREYSRSVRQDEESWLRNRDHNARSTRKRSLPEEQSGLTDLGGYGSKEIVITGVTLSTEGSQNAKSLYALEPFEVLLNWHAKESICNPVFAFCIYLPTGECASQWLVSSRELGTEVISGDGRVSFRSPQLLLGNGHYVASVGIFKNRPERGLEPPAFHVLDRTVHFRVLNTDPGDSTEYGVCHQPVMTELMFTGTP